jgi:uncharacterized protein DUF6011
MQGRIESIDGVIAYLFGPKLRGVRTAVTIVSKRTGTRFTYEIAEKDPDERQGQVKPSRVFFVDVLTGMNNERDFSALAVVTEKPMLVPRGRPGGLTVRQSFHARAAKISADAPSAVAWRWFFELIRRGDEEAFLQVEVYHEGRCGRCGRRLSVPSSVASGMGPECASK